MEKIMIPGPTFRIGETDFVLAPLNLASARAHKKFFETGWQAANGGVQDLGPAALFEMADIVFESLQRNYPDLKRDEVDAHLDLSNIPDAFIAVMTAGKAGPAAGETKPGNR